MSSNENEGPDTDPTGQFDAFRARQADDRMQQETQTAYSFPPDYAAPPEPVFYPTTPTAEPANRMRSVLIFVGAVLAAGVLGLGAWLAFGSSSSTSANTASSGVSPSASASPTSTAAKHGLAFRMTIVSLGADSFTGTVLANGASVTVTLTDKTRFGTKAHPFSKSDLRVGELVAVRGKRTGTSAITATEVTEPVRSSP